jgi:hypothetical protein
VSTVSPKFEGGPIKTEEPSLVASLRKRNQRPLVTHKRSIGSPPASRRRHVPIESIGKADNFIDDLIVIILGVPGNISRSNAVAALALELVSRPPHAQEPVFRGHLASFSKLITEWRPVGVKTILGWTLDTVDSSCL